MNENFTRPRQLRDGTLPKLSPEEQKELAAPATVGHLLQMVRDVQGPITNSVVHLLAEARKRIAALEARPTVEYRGVWDASARCMAGVRSSRRSGSMWHATEASVGRRPGSDAAFGGWLSRKARTAAMERIRDDHTTTTDVGV